MAGPEMQMNQYHLVHSPSGQAVAVVIRAGGWLAKGWGVLGRRSLAVGEGLWLPGVASVHTIGVRLALDLLFLDGKMQMVRHAECVGPGRWLVRAVGAAHTVELGAGTLATISQQIAVGDAWRLERLP